MKSKSMFSGKWGGFSFLYFCEKKVAKNRDNFAVQRNFISTRLAKQEQKDW